MIMRMPPIPREKKSVGDVAVPAPACAMTPPKGSTRALADGRGELLLDGKPAGIYASDAQAQEGLGVYKRMGLAR